MKIFETLNGTFINFEKFQEISWVEDDNEKYYSYIYFEGREKLDFLDLGTLTDDKHIHNLHVLAVEYILRSGDQLVRYEELIQFINNLYIGPKLG